MKREVRQRCGFGCVLCGLPLYHYDHMNEYSVVKEHEAENLTLLCAQHHDEKTKGLLPLAKVQAANADPFNLRAGASRPHYLHYSGNRAVVALGSNEFTSDGGDFVAVLVDGVPLIYFRFESEQALLTVQLFDDFNQPLLQIVDNELVYSVSTWDVEFVGTTLTIRAASRDIFLVVKFCAPDRLEIIRGRLLLNGVRILIQNGIVTVGDSLMMVGSRAVNCAAGLNVGHDPTNMPSGYRVVHVNRYATHQPAATS
ncbi:hypothetical protein A6F59_10910 [Prescottella equi]|nr:hypothetical protein A6F59_10910 [Prescottella equi]